MAKEIVNPTVGMILTLGESIRVLRVREKIAPIEVAHSAGVSFDAVTSIENDLYGKYTLGDLVAVAGVFKRYLHVRLVPYEDMGVTEKKEEKKEKKE